MDFLSWLANWASIISLVLMVFGELSFVVWWRKHNKAVDGLTKAFDSDEDMPLIRKLGIDPTYLMRSCMTEFLAVQTFLSDIIKQSKISCPEIFWLPYGVALPCRYRRMLYI